ncbi:hypothetical protein [Bacillus altitudinis]|uniref:hypothetical protein n=1 Tax=Bacillus altitudinis TaxID=293387 RepID=UPI0011A12188|nr:hypothetical protein [Bacillus altitudinis]
MREHFGDKVFKVGLEGGFDCGNGDGSVGDGGWRFWRAGGCGDFGGKGGDDVMSEFNEMKEGMDTKWKDGK